MSLILTGDTASGSTRTLLTDSNGILQVAINANGDNTSPVPVSLVGDALSSVTVSGTVAVSNQPTSIQVSNFPSSTEISNDVGNPIPISGTVAISNPQTSVSISGTPSVSISGTPAVSATISGTPSVTISGTPSVSATVSNFPSTQAVSGTVNANVQGGNTTAIKVDGSSVTQPVSGSVTATISGTPSVSISNSPSVSVSNFPATQAVSAASLPLPTGAATSALQTSGNNTLSSILSAVQAQVSLSTSVWADNTVNPPVYYVRNTTDNAGTINVTWTTPAGVTATPTVSNLVPISNVQNIVVENQNFTATASGTGYSSGDVIIHTYGIDSTTSPASVSFSIWFNATTGSVITTPTSANLANAIQPVSGTVAATQSGSWTTSISGTPTVSISGTVPVSGTFYQATQPISAASLPLPSGAAQESGNLAAVATNTGHLTDGTQTTKIVNGANTLALDSSGRPTVNINGTVPVSGTFYQATQPVSVASLPLPTGAAQDGTDGTGITAPTGGSGIRGWLSGIYSKLSSALAVTQSGTWTTGRTWNLASGSDSVTATISGTPSVSAAVSNFPSSQAVTNAGTFAVQPSAGDLTSGNQTTKIVNGANTLALDSSGRPTVNVNGTVPVSGAFWQTTQPVSIASLPALATGTNAIGSITNTSFGVSSLPSLVAGTANIGSTPPVAGALTAYNGTLTANTSTQIIAGATLTKYLFVQNTSATTMYLAFGTAATTSNGIQIPASGGSMVFESNFLTNQSVNLLNVSGGNYVAWGL